jgi:hypothetical protein
MTRLGEISSFGLFFKGPGIFLGKIIICCKYFKSLEGVYEDGLNIPIEL